MKLPIDKTKKLTEELMDLLGVEAKISLSTQGETLSVSLDSEKYKGLLIGYRGDTLNGIQTFLTLALKNKTGEWYRVVVNVGDWREKQDDYLKSLAASAVSRAKATGEGQPLYNLNAGQRRTIHMYLANEKTISTESFGEGKERYLVVKPKK
ncbi:MAG: hypothetical protein ACD_52C00110G0003 [uncultured bacterium]|uniref:R3H domain-containing protein n=1 Tax=Candidatus Woesebacteria bacterium RIFCSPHIGHO2_12_FULL_41_24 TaxID=1802510 RepID=A0A1F8ATP6_9BACT|nr:MAG: hypothetical protein ACD_52C00110G0003 [uncultured bacterium]OGM14678.1 MAG: hypothetical protein A2W15_01800 [Candidatus Woesebacteria bacterium RBG_16_41_13]OGM29692.1 MAG: hypothetical protein A2873_02220 [Candidatus Woesebacteria bacterium RIFCSPHIGHO2_01_FULL_42_80]OGM35220.1 MAG: hypothetical protein A3D84_00300 [Candidatus Woesebacteria bacterium RIFCSPHIGHO2_02_FULL_42_20]OGM55114.1 MAG: hypothetical protein A3E44_04305 [Candidatus Woesebacteria bacterium RIFCSPHIGHO2_12_FULL_41